MTQPKGDRMKFKFAARVIAQLGAELISSDDIAVYELIKNSFDAGATKAILAIEFLVELQAIATAQQTIATAFLEKPRRNEKPEAKETRVRNLARELLHGFEPIHAAFLPILAERIEFLDDQLPQAATLNGYLRLLGSINQLFISDSGHGMTKDTLERSFLTIGTTYRYLEHQALSQEVSDQDLIPPAGEKGIGRLSAMRLGNDLEVQTWNKKEKIAHLLRLDWRLFGPESALPANEIEIDYSEALRPEGQGASGTKLQISDLQSPWDREKTKEVAAKFFSRFTDPFTVNTSRNVDITWNRNRIEVPGLSQRFLQESQAGMKGIVTIEADQRFTLTIDFWYVEKETKIRHDVRHVYSSADFGGIKDEDIADIGPFDFELHHFNRLRIAAIPGLATRKEFRDWLDEWTGGLMLYRDGLRVMPYGRQPDDDWLELDRRALRRGGFRVNRIQTIGRVRISRRKNPRLVDQTNREGLRDNATERRFREFLIRIIQDLFAKTLDKFIGNEGATDEQLIARGVNLQQEVETAVENLLNAADEGRLERIREAHLEVKRVMETVPALAGDLKDSIQNQVLGRIEVLELSATGMTAASIAHDLEAALDQAIEETGGMAKIASLAPRQRESLLHLTGLFKSLRTLVEDIKPGPAKSRRRKSTFGLSQLLEHLKSFYSTQLEKHGITVDIHDSRSVKIKAVEGHVRQIFDNLFRNSIYWIADTNEKHPEEAKAAKIEIGFDHASRTLVFRDSGVGIALHDAEWVFRPFATHKKQGTGLGLYISKEFCEFNGIKIAVDTSALNKWRRCPQFILDLSACYLE